MYFTAEIMFEVTGRTINGVTRLPLFGESGNLHALRLSDSSAIHTFKLNPRSISLAGMPPRTPQLFSSGSDRTITASLS